jgi:hypothetical protein
LSWKAKPLERGIARLPRDAVFLDPILSGFRGTVNFREVNMNKKTEAQRDLDFLRKYWFQNGDTLDVHISNMKTLIASIRSDERSRCIRKIKELPVNDGWSNEQANTAVLAIKVRRGKER